MRSSAARSRACGLTPASRARSDSSLRRAFWLSTSMYSSMMFFGSCVSADSTAWMPNISSPLTRLPPFGCRHLPPLRGGRISAAKFLDLPFPRLRGKVPKAKGGGSRREPAVPNCPHSYAFPLRLLRRQPEIDLAILEARAQHLHANCIAEAELQTALFAAQQMPHRIKVIVVIRQLGDVDETADLRF